MKVLYCVSEAVPFVKTGGLADVAGALPAALRDLGHDVRLVLPRYRAISPESLSPLFSLRIHVGGSAAVDGAVLQGESATGIPVYFVDCPRLFDREGLYGERGRDYADNLQRFAFFSQAAVAVAAQVFSPDLLHCNDWHTGLIPAYLHQRDRAGQRSWPTLLTVHNIAMQGLFPADQFAGLGLHRDYLTPGGVEFWGKVSCLKAGLVYADVISTVSETYAREIQTPEFGAGLEQVLIARRRDLFGILNGADYSQWDPRVDTYVPARYGPNDLEGKRICKRALQREGGLEPLPYAPLLGMVSRLTDQKGCDLVAAVLQPLLARGVQFVLLGTGDARYHALFTYLARTHPRQVFAALTFDEGLAHRIEAGVDMFLMPSRFEPSGLNQLYSMRYGTVPIVRRTGGLADSVVDATPEALRDGRATGFVFDAYTPEALLAVIERALAAFRDPITWRRLQQAGMRADFSWRFSAERYVALFREVLGRRVSGPAGRSA